MCPQKQPSKCHRGKIMPHKSVSDVEGKPGMMQLCDAAHPRVSSLLDINLFPVKRLTWPCGTCEPTAGERANPGWVHTSLEGNATFRQGEW